ncbi:hypothetical protein VTN00DRAFT_1754 [Thermoascus crustaceus]|uniref:uncharacterized protein n=1 Tax=Thermoascus crustaceus TaxID=5088 RepID=UPI0037429CF3
MSETVRDVKSCPLQPPTGLNLSNYQRFWEQLHHNTVKLIQQIKEEEKSETQDKSSENDSETKT